MRPALQRVLTAGCCCLAACGAAPAAEPGATHSLDADGTIALSGASRDYVLTEPAAPPSPTARRTLVAHVSFDEGRVAAIGSPVAGRVVSVAVVTGAPVHRGDPLLTIHSADVASAQAALVSARAARMLAEQTAARAAHLVRQGAASPAESAQAATALEEARVEERGAGATIGGARGAERANLSPVIGCSCHMPGPQPPSIATSSIEHETLTARHQACIRS